MNRSPPPVSQTVKYQVEEPLPPFLSSDAVASAKGTPDRSRKPHLPESQTQTCHGDSVLIEYLAPDRPDIAAHALNFPLANSPPSRKRIENDYAAEKVQVPLPQAPVQVSHDLKREGGSGSGSGSGDESERDNTKPPRNEPLPPPLAPMSSNTVSVSPKEYPKLPSIQAPDRRPSEDRLGTSLNNSTRRSPDNIISLPSFHSLHSPPSSCVATSPDSGSGNSRVLPPIRSALDGLSPTAFPPHPRLGGLPPLCSYPGSTSSRHDSPHDRQLPQLLPQQIPPSPFSHLSPVSTKDASNNPSPASTAPFWRGPPPPPPPSEPIYAASPYDMSPMTAKSPATGYPTPIEQVGPTQGSGERSSFDSQASANGIPATGSYKCTHPGCTAAPFQTQYLLK